MGGIYDSTIVSTTVIGMSSVWSCITLPDSKLSSKWILALELAMVAGKVIGISALSSCLTSTYSKFLSTSILTFFSTYDASSHKSMILMSVVVLTSFRDGVGLDNIHELDERNGFDALVSQRTLDKFGDADTVGAFEAYDDADEGFFDLETVKV